MSDATRIMSQSCHSNMCHVTVICHHVSDVTDVSTVTHHYSDATWQTRHDSDMFLLSHVQGKFIQNKIEKNMKPSFITCTKDNHNIEVNKEIDLWVVRFFVILRQAIFTNKEVVSAVGFVDQVIVLLVI